MSLPTFQNGEQKAPVLQDSKKSFNSNEVASSRKADIDVRVHRAALQYSDWRSSVFGIFSTHKNGVQINSSYSAHEITTTTGEKFCLPARRFACSAPFLRKRSSPSLEVLSKAKNHLGPGVPGVTQGTEKVFAGRKAGLINDSQAPLCFPAFLRNSDFEHTTRHRVIHPMETKR